MIVEFTVGNYRSFREAQTLSFVATDDTSLLEENTVEVAGLRLLKSIVLYGPNGGGKSNFLGAWILLQSLIRHSNTLSSDDKLPVNPFAFDETSSNEPTFFEVIFITNNETYTYGVRLNEHAITEEYLTKNLANNKTETIFNRIGSNDVKSDVLDPEIVNLASKVLRANGLLISVLESLNDKYTHAVRNTILNMGASRSEQRINESVQLTRELLTTDSGKQRVLKLLEKSDLSITDTGEFIQPVYVQGQQQYVEMPVPYSSHNVYDSKGNVIGQKKMEFFSSESDGTVKLFGMLGFLFHTLDKNSLLLWDELESRLHPLQVKNIISLFHEQNKGQSQLLFTTHNVSLLDPKLFRSDQINFVTKNKMEASVIYSLSEFEMSHDDMDNWDTLYLKGRFGATPHVTKLS